MAYEPRGDHRHAADKGFNRAAAGEDGGAPRARGRREYFCDSLLSLLSRFFSTALPRVSRDALLAVWTCRFPISCIHPTTVFLCLMLYDISTELLVKIWYHLGIYRTSP